jgi:hypothetical protein
MPSSVRQGRQMPKCPLFAAPSAVVARTSNASNAESACSLRNTTLPRALPLSTPPSSTKPPLACPRPAGAPYTIHHAYGLYTLSLNYRFTHYGRLPILFKGMSCYNPSPQRGQSLAACHCNLTSYTLLRKLTLPIDHPHPRPHLPNSLRLPHQPPPPLHPPPPPPLQRIPAPPAPLPLLHHPIQPPPAPLLLPNLLPGTESMAEATPCGRRELCGG